MRRRMSQQDAQRSRNDVEANYQRPLVRVAQVTVRFSRKKNFIDPIVGIFFFFLCRFWSEIFSLTSHSWLKTLLKLLSVLHTSTEVRCTWCAHTGHFKVAFSSHSKQIQVALYVQHGHANKPTGSNWKRKRAPACLNVAFASPTSSEFCGFFFSFSAFSLVLRARRLHAVW